MRLWARGCAVCILYIYMADSEALERTEQREAYIHMCVCVRAIFISFIHVPFFWEMEGDDFAGLVLRSVEITR